MSVIEIPNLVTLQALALLSDWSSDTYILANDIDASGTSHAEYGTGTGGDPISQDIGNLGGEGFLPIADAINEFNTSFDGNGFTITGLYISRGGITDLGLFGAHSTFGTIRNVNVLNVDITGFERCGGLSGKGSGTIINCHSSGSVTTSGKRGGGLQGTGNPGLDISYSSSSCTVTSGDKWCGGFIGYTAASVTFHACFSTGDVHPAYNESGGFVGSLGSTSASVVTDCYCTGNVTGSSVNANTLGGFAGLLSGTVNGCFATGDVTSVLSDNIGGFAGSVATAVVSLADCFSSGSVTGVNGVGGFNGSAQDTVVFTNCYSTGAVSGTLLVGGFCGEVVLSATFTDCFYDSDTSGQTGDTQGVAKTTAEMQSQDTFTNWGFNTTWKMFDYPELRSFIDFNDIYNNRLNDAYGSNRNDLYNNGDNDLYNSKANKIYAS